MLLSYFLKCNNYNFYALTLSTTFVKQSECLTNNLT